MTSTSRVLKNVEGDEVVEPETLLKPKLSATTALNANGVLLKLCDSILVSLLVDWIDIEDLGYFDMALANTNDRKWFLDLVTQNYFIHNSNKTPDEFMFYQWLCARGLRVSNMMFPGYKWDAFLHYFPMNLSFRKLEIDGESLILTQDILFQVEWLALSGTADDFTDKLFDSLQQKFRYLKKLEISSKNETYFSNETIDKIVSYLPHLTAYVGPISSLTMFDKCPHLTEVNLERFHENEHYFPGFFDSLIKKYNKLSLLYLPYNYHTPDKFVVDLASKCLLLTHFQTAGINITDATITKLTLACKHLTCVRLCSANILTDVGLNSIAKNCTNLTELWITFGELVTDTGVSEIFKRCQKLSILSVKGCVLLTDATIIAILENNVQLKGLGMGYCPNITTEHISTVLDKLYGSLELVSFDNSPITSEIYTQFSKNSDEIVFDNREDNNYWWCTNKILLRCNVKRFVWVFDPLINTFEITTTEFEKVGTLSPELKKVKFISCDWVKFEHVAALITRCPLLKCLDFRDCSIPDSIEFTTLLEENNIECLFDGYYDGN